MKQWLWRVSLWLLLPGVVLAREIPPDEARDLYYASYKMPSQLSVSRLESLISRTANQIHGIGFQYLGVNEDWFHGHVLLENQGSKAAPRFFPARDFVPHSRRGLRRPLAEGQRSQIRLPERHYP